MPHCKQKMYCVFFLGFFSVVWVVLFKGGRSQLIANQTGRGQIRLVLFSTGKKITSHRVQYFCIRKTKNIQVSL